MKVYTKEQIEEAIDLPFLLTEIEKGLVSYSKKQTFTSPIGFLHFDHPRGDVHIKSGAILGDDFYVVKVASGFYDNPTLGLPSSNGLMLLFSQINGQLQAILMDEGFLTDLRTGLAGAVAAKYLANQEIHKIGIIGTGTQAREQLRSLASVSPCKEVLVWGRTPMKAEIFSKDPALSNFRISLAKNLDHLTAECDLIITTTPASKPLLFGHQIRPGTHITAVGADGVGKQELDATIFQKADIIAVDSYEQCIKYGDLAHAGPLKNSVFELGELISNPPKRAKHAITVADLTGVAVEDLQIAKAVYSRLCSETINLV